MITREHIDRSDNLRIIHYKHQPQAAAFMALIVGLDDGSAVDPCEPETQDGPETQAGGPRIA